MWKQVIDFENYEINEEGAIRSGDKIMKQYLNHHGYYTLSLFNNDGEKKKSIHRLIGLHFIPNPDNLPYIDHINGKRADNRIENLRWVTREQNYWNNKGKGYCFNSGKFQAKIRQNGKTIYLGRYDTPEEARKAYEEKFLEIRDSQFLRI